MKRQYDVHIYILPIYVIKLVTVSVQGIVRRRMPFHIFQSKSTTYCELRNMKA